MRRACIALLILAGCSFDTSVDTPDTESGIVHRTLSVAPSALGRIDDFPVLVVLDSSRIEYELVADPIENLDFFDGEQNAPYEVERWDPQGRSHIWVLIDRLEGTPGELIMVYGPDVQSPGPDPGSVWKRYEAVWHFDNESLTNSVGPDFAGVSTGTTRDGSGMAAGARRFSNANDSFMEFANSGALLDGADRFSIEWWIFPEYDTSADVSGEPKVLEKAGVLINGRLLPASEIDSQTDVQFTGGSNTVFARFQIQPRAWNYLAYTFDNKDFREFRNGENVSTSNREGERLPTSSSDLILGATGGRAFNGLIDELRIADDGLARRYVAHQNESMNDRLIEYGPAVPQ